MEIFNKNMDSDIKKLIELTTIIKVDDNKARKTIFGDEHFISRFQRDQGQQTDLSDLGKNWEKKWQSFGNEWNEDRQNHRFLLDSFKLFYFSFEQLRFNKVACINHAFDDRFKMTHFNELTGVALYGMYYHGKTCIKLLKILNLINKQCADWDFCNKYSETRNKIIAHNFNPGGLNLRVDPSIWSLAGTDSRLEIHIHKPNVERAFDAYVDYYEDYYQLEKIIVDIIKGF